MPQQASPFTPIPSFLSRPADQLQQMSPPPQNMAPPGQGGPPGGPQGPPGGGGLPSMNPLENMDGLQVGSEGGKPDPFEKLVQMLMSMPQIFMPFLAGMGAVKAMDKANKQHRPNSELAAQGQDVGMPGQTGMPNEQQLMQQAQMPKMGGQVGFG